MQTLNILCGPSYSGKSRFAQARLSSDTVILSSDTVRLALFGSEDDQSHNAEVFDFMGHMTKYFLTQGKSVTIDATNIRRWERAKYIAIAKSISPSIEIIAFVFLLPSSNSDLNYRMNSRTRKVPRDIVSRQEQNFEMPTGAEGFNFIKMVNQ